MEFSPLQYTRKVGVKSATKSVTSSRQSRGLVADINHESPRHKSRRRLSWFVSETLSGTCPGLCRKVGVMEIGLNAAVQHLAACRRWRQTRGGRQRTRSSYIRGKCSGMQKQGENVRGEIVRGVMSVSLFNALQLWGKRLCQSCRLSPVVAVYHSVTDVLWLNGAR